MALDDDDRQAVEREVSRLRIADGWARINKSASARQFDAGRNDRLSGKPCRSANGQYLDGWYSV